MTDEKEEVSTVKRRSLTLQDKVYKTRPQTIKYGKWYLTELVLDKIVKSVGNWTMEDWRVFEKEHGKEFYVALRRRLFSRDLKPDGFVKYETFRKRSNDWRYSEN